MRGTAILGGLLVAALGLARTRVGPTPSAPSEEPPRARPDAPPVEAEAPPAPERTDAPVLRATRYASLTSGACLAELDARHVAYVRVERGGVETPVRIVAPLSGVRFRTLLPRQARERSRYEICDCRLVLALDDFAKILARHGIDDVMYFSAFRPLVPGVTKRGHESALAIDVAFLGRGNHGAYSVVRDFTPIPQERPCAPLIRAKGPLELREIACEAATEGIFHVVLTPDYDAKHRDHFHLEIVPGEDRSFAR